MNNICVIHGRFQPLHIGHMEYLLAGKSRCSMLIIGITNPDPFQTKNEESDANRGKLISNPCTYYERYSMIEEAMVENGIKRDDFRIVPFPISFPERIEYYVPLDSEFIVSIYDSWGESKLDRLKQLNLKTHVLWRREKKITTGTFIRESIAYGKEWKHLVPNATFSVIKFFDIESRIKRLFFENSLFL